MKKLTKNEKLTELWNIISEDSEVTISPYKMTMLFEYGFEYYKETYIKKEGIEELSLSDLRLLITECANEMDGWKNTNTEELSEEGEVLNKKLEKLWKVYNNRVKDLLKSVKL